MNRPIEFRAWDRSENKWLKSWVFNCLIKPNELPFSTEFNINTPEWIILNQYTGLKDKSGRKIFEGDVVIGSKGDFMSNVIGVVKYSGLAFVFEGRTEETQYALCGGKGDNYWRYTVTTSSLSNLNEIEVIGNIYENPELLKDTKC